MTFFARHETALRSLETRGRYRQLIPRAGHDFASNDYLGLAESDVLQAAARSALDRGVPVGAGGSRLLRGNQDEHCLLEQEAATFFDTEAALFVGGGFVANTAIFSTLPAQGDLVLYDALIHASTHDGMRLGRADSMAFAHNDVTDAAERIRLWREAGNTGQIWLACESLYSMDGDLAPIDDLATLAAETDAVLVVDEAHATGVFGDLGRGVSHSYANRENTLTLHTCGKGLGVSGALICGAQALIDTLINRARGFVFATAPSPLNAALVRVALTELRTNPARQERARALIAHAHAEAKRQCGLVGFQSQILPVITGKDKPTMALATHMQELGYDIRGIRPPTVPRNTARLRISITLNTSADVVTQMMHDLSLAMKEHSQ
jgi:8-amino-7-oxononanoate synthase